jgi:light-independent protochlorophyllide reductase subunit N
MIGESRVLGGSNRVFEPQGEVIERDDFCSLAPIGWLHHKMQDSFFLVVGTGSCQGFLQTALGVMVFAKPRFATAVLDEDDLGGADPLTGLLPLVEAVVAEHEPRAIFLASTCTPEILKMNVAGCAPPLEERFGVRVYPCRLDGFDPAYTQGEDHVLEAMIARAPETEEKNLVILGCLSAIEEAEIRLECAAMGLPEPRFLPAESALDVPPIGPNTVLAAVHPYLYGAVSYAQRERGCAIHKSLFPYGPDGTRAFYESLAAAFGKSISYAEREQEAWTAIARETAPLKDRSIAFCSDAMLELPLARTLRAAGARVELVGTPNLYKKFHAAEVATLQGVEILERPDRFELFARFSAARPDLVVANLNVANPLEGMGFSVKWSTELTFQPIHGFSGAASLFGMFASSLRRHDALAKRRAADGASGAPIDLEFFRPIERVRA